MPSILKKRKTDHIWSPSKSKAFYITTSGLDPDQNVIFYPKSIYLYESFLGTNK